MKVTLEEQFVTPHIAKALKKLGYNECCLAIHTNKYPGKVDMPLAIEQRQGFVVSGDPNEAFFDNDYYFLTVPLWQQAIDWLREKYQYHFELIPDEDTGEWFCIDYFILKMMDTGKQGPFKTYAEAREAGVMRGLEAII